MRLLYTILLSFIVLASQAQIENGFPIGARAMAMGTTSICNADLWATNNNPGALGFVKNSAIGAYYENRFGVSGLGYKSIAGVYNNNFGNFGLRMNYFGYSSYNSIITGISYGRSFGDYFSGGIQIDYLYTSLSEGYGSTGMAIAELGLLSRPTKNLSIAAYTYNPTMTQYNTSENTEKIPTLFKLGASYNFEDAVILNVEVQKNIDYKPVYAVGVEFNLVKNFIARTGVSSNQSLLSFGLGYKTEKLHFDIAFAYNSYLGYSPFVSLIYEFNKTTSKPKE